MGKIYSIQYLRGIACLLVVLLHIKSLMPVEYRSLFSNGGIGVDIFFIISGFIIYYATSNPGEAKGNVYFTKRILRIYPLFFVVWLITSILNYGAEPFSEVIRALFFIHNDYKVGAPGFGFNMIGPAWTLTFEVIFYLLFMVSCLISHKYRGLLCIIMLIAIPAGLQLYFNGSFSLSSYATANPPSDNPAFGLIRVLGCPIYFEFAIGILLSMLMKKVHVRVNSSSLMIVSFSGFVISIILIMSFSISETQKFILALSSFIFVLLIDFSHAKEIRILSFLGDISYAMYLCHWMIIKTYITFYPKEWNPDNSIVKVTTVIILTVALSYILHRLIEKPGIKLARKILN
ncbi:MULTISPECIES: acyltransferase family protein [Enterobacter]|uniref:acyltransferase family protein n=1 Tax=Enterobacter TaxID=547 RepID=UPI0015E4E9BD|nr:MULTISPECIES: acyltransferase [Enterobacter]MDC7311858.1 acyltransferase [Enterobacter ludwigii]MDI0401910.1 acyltransferase [Enterobacter ludwigii]MDI0411455.1 acyltransferase [Enterobacter ludwigii]MDI0416922.1 acyltransferase [Enterobacter ludwigii]MDI0428600.1 acyltransferase [Enterobacter ludwigii]